MEILEVLIKSQTNTAERDVGCLSPGKLNSSFLTFNGKNLALVKILFCFGML